MSAVGLVYVGAVLFINGLLLLGWLKPREAAPLNIFVGALQVIIPTFLIMTAATDSAAIYAASGLYLFGFTYLWVGINLALDYSHRGFGWFALFVAACCVVFAAHSFLSVGDISFGVLWLVWCVLWFLFFLVMGLDLETLGAATGFFTVIVGLITATAGFLILLDSWTGGTLEAIIITIAGVLALILAKPAANALRKTNKEEQTPRAQADYQQ